MKCPGPGFCPFANEARYTHVLMLVAMVLLLMTAVAIAAICKGKDGVITGACCAASTSVVTAVLIGGLHRHRDHNSPPHPEDKGGDSNNA